MERLTSRTWAPLRFLPYQRGDGGGRVELYMTSMSSSPLARAVSMAVGSGSGSWISRAGRAGLAVTFLPPAFRHGFWPVLHGCGH